jgi:hypothetical protein
MNTHEGHGGVRYAGGKMAKASGDARDRCDRQADGGVHQVVAAAGGCALAGLIHGQRG